MRTALKSRMARAASRLPAPADGYMARVRAAVANWEAEHGPVDPAPAQDMMDLAASPPAEFGDKIKAMSDLAFMRLLKWETLHGEVL